MPADHPQISQIQNQLVSQQAAEKLRTIHEITRTGTKEALVSSHFVSFRGSSLFSLSMDSAAC